MRLVPIPDQSDSGSTLAPPTSSCHSLELSPDTSFASVDENDLTEIYDRFGSQSPPPNKQGQPLENGFDEIELIPIDRLQRVGNQSTPKKPTRSRRRMRGGGEGEEEGGGGEVVEVMCTTVRSDLQSLLKLATDLHVSSLIQR